MKSISINLGFYQYHRTFPSYSYFLSYLFDILTKLLLVLLIVVLPVAYLLDYSIFMELNRVLLLVNISVFVFYLMLIRRIIVKQRVVRGSFDMTILFFATFSLISVSLSAQKVMSVFGRVGLNEYSIINILTFMVVFFALLEAFSYKKGYKWLLFSITISALTSGLWYIYEIKNSDWVIDNAYYSNIFFLMPVLIANIFIFKRMWIKILSFLTMFVLLILIGTQQTNITYQVESALWSLSFAALAAIVLIYFKLWMYNTDKVLDMFADLPRSIKDKKNIIILLILILVAVGILFFGYNIIDTYRDRIYPQFRPTLDQLEDASIKELILGQGLDNTNPRSSWIIGLTTGLGIFSSITFVLIELMLVMKTIKYLDVKLLINDFNRFMVKILHFTATTGILVYTVFAQMNSLITLLLLVFIVIYSNPQKTIIFLDEHENRSRKAIIIKSLIALIITAAMIALYIGLGRAIEKEVFAIGRV